MILAKKIEANVSDKETSLRRGGGGIMAMMGVPDILLNIKNCCVLLYVVVPIRGFFPINNRS